MEHLRKMLIAGAKACRPKWNPAAGQAFKEESGANIARK